MHRSSHLRGINSSEWGWGGGGAILSMYDTDIEGV